MTERAKREEYESVCDLLYVANHKETSVRFFVDETHVNIVAVLETPRRHRALVDELMDVLNSLGILSSLCGSLTTKAERLRSEALSEAEAEVSELRGES